MTKEGMRSSTAGPQRSIVLSVVAMIVVAVVAFFGVRSLLGNNSAGDAGVAPSSGASASSASVGSPGAAAAQQSEVCGQLVGVDLACLGDTKPPAASASGAPSGVTVVNVWAWWCKPCRAELPLLVEAAKEHREWTLVGVHADKSADLGQALLRDLGVEMFSYQDYDNSFAGHLGLPGVIPITVVLENGQVKGSIVKAMTTKEEIAREVEALL